MEVLAYERVADVTTLVASGNVTLNGETLKPLVGGDFVMLGVILGAGASDTEDIVCIPAGQNNQVTLSLRVGVVHRIKLRTIISVGTTSESVQIVGV